MPGSAPDPAFPTPPRAPAGRGGGGGGGGGVWYGQDITFKRWCRTDAFTANIGVVRLLLTLGFPIYAATPAAERGPTGDLPAFTRIFAHLRYAVTAHLYTLRHAHARHTRYRRASNTPGVITRTVINLLPLNTPSMPGYHTPRGALILLAHTRHTPTHGYHLRTCPTTLPLGKHAESSSSCL